MKKNVLMALVALTIILTPSGALAVPPKTTVTTSTQDIPVIVGAVWDMPFNYRLPDIDTSNSGAVDKTDYNKEVEEIAQALAEGRDMVIAGGPEGTVSNEMFLEIMQRANVINPNHSGSIVRIGGMTMDDTRVALSIYLSSLWEF